MSCTAPWAGKRQIRPSELQSTLTEVWQQTGVRPNDITSRSRVRRIAHARQLAMWKLRETDLYSYPEIGRAFGRDHTTAIHACRAVEARMEAAQ